MTKANERRLRSTTRQATFRIDDEYNDGWKGFADYFRKRKAHKSYSTKQNVKDHRPFIHQIINNAKCSINTKKSKSRICKDPPIYLKNHVRENLERVI